MAKRSKLEDALRRVQNQQQLRQRAAKHVEAQRAKQESMKQKQRTDQATKISQNLYKSNDRILLVGEANFSFAVALKRLFDKEMKVEKMKSKSETNVIYYDSDDEVVETIESASAGCIVATTLDTREITFDKYPDTEKNILVLEDAENATVLFGIDAMTLDKQQRVLQPPFDRIVFQFPHVGLGITDLQRNILANQKLLFQFMRSCKDLLSPLGQVHITMKSGEPYDSWNIRSLARDAGLFSFRTVPFRPEVYEGYAHRRTSGFVPNIDENEEIVHKNCRTYIFTKEPPTMKKKRKRGNQSSDEE